MRIALVSDIHGNLAALEAVVAEFADGSGFLFSVIESLVHTRLRMANEAVAPT